MKNILWIIVGVIGLKLLINLARFFKCNIFLDKYCEWIKNPSFEIIENKAEIVKLWQSANVEDRYSPRVSPMGLGQIATYNKGVFFSFPSNEEDLAHATISMFYEARGVFKKRIIDSINPLSWLEAIIFFPRIAMQYLGYKGNGFVLKIFQFVWWLFGIFVSIMIATYNNEIHLFVRKLFGG